MKKENWDIIINRLRRDERIAANVASLTADEVPWIADALAASFDQAWTLGMIEYHNHVMDNTTDAATYNALATERDRLLRKKQEKGW